MIITCQACGQKNRVREEHLALPARCGKCKTPLAPVAEPLDADRELFDAVNLMRKAAPADAQPLFVELDGLVDQYQSHV